MAQTTVKSIGDDTLLGILLLEGSTGVTGEFPTIEIRRKSDNFYLDFLASSSPFFVATGGLKKKILTPSPYQDGLYTYNYTPSAVGETVPEEYVILYENVSPSYSMLDFEILAYTESLITALSVHDTHLSLVASQLETTICSKNQTNLSLLETNQSMLITLTTTTGPNLSTDIAYIRKLLDNNKRLTLISSTLYDHIIYDDDGITILTRYNIVYDGTNEDRIKTV